MYLKKKTFLIDWYVQILFKYGFINALSLMVVQCISE